MIGPSLTHVVVACDEAGAKGYADRDEQFAGELGVYAGVLLDVASLPAAQAAFDTVAQQYVSPDGKLHITDLRPEQQAALREDIFALIRAHDVACLYEAIHVAGFHYMFQRLKEVVERARQSRQSNIKLSGNLTKAQPESLHATLFQGLYGKIVAFCADRGKTRLHVELRLDPIDAPVLEVFNDEAISLLQAMARTITVTAFDPIMNEKVQGVVRTEVKELPEIETTIEELSITSSTNRIDGLILAADIVANSAAYHLGKARPQQDRFRALNTREAICRHPLSDHFVCLGEGTVADTLYRHPQDPDLSQVE